MHNVHSIKVFGQAFFKKLAGCGAAPHDFGFDLMILTL